MGNTRLIFLQKRWEAHILQVFARVVEEGSVPNFASICSLPYLVLVLFSDVFFGGPPQKPSGPGKVAAILSSILIVGTISLASLASLFGGSKGSATVISDEPAGHGNLPPSFDGKNARNASDKVNIDDSRRTWSTGGKAEKGGLHCRDGLRTLTLNLVGG